MYVWLGGGGGVGGEGHIYCDQLLLRRNILSTI